MFFRINTGVSSPLDFPICTWMWQIRSGSEIFRGGERTEEGRRVMYGILLKYAKCYERKRMSMRN